MITKQINKKLVAILLLSSFLYANDTVLQVQTQLNELGYNLGIVDGVMGEQTADAIRTYQEEYGLNVTGRATKSLLKHLDPPIESVDAAITKSVTESKKTKIVRNDTKNKASNKFGFLSKDSYFAYNYVEVGWSSFDSTISYMKHKQVDSDKTSLYFLGSFDILPNINLVAEYKKFSGSGKRDFYYNYRKYTSNYDSESSQWSAGIGYHQKIANKLDIIANMKYYKKNVKVDYSISRLGIKSNTKYDTFNTPLCQDSCPKLMI